MYISSMKTRSNKVPIKLETNNSKNYKNKFRRKIEKPRRIQESQKKLSEIQMCDKKKAKKITSIKSNNTKARHKIGNKYQVLSAQNKHTKNKSKKKTKVNNYIDHLKILKNKLKCLIKILEQINSINFKFNYRF